MPTASSQVQPPVRRAARLAALVFASWFLSTAPAVAGPPSDVRIANVTDRQFSVSWISAAAETGSLRWGMDPASLAFRAEDDRGAGSASPASVTHHVTVSGLTPSTVYYVDVVSGAATDNNGGAHYRVATGPTLDPGSPPPAAYGQVYRADGSSPAGILVYGTLRDNDGRGSPGASSLVSGIVQDKDQGYWYLHLGAARLADLSGPFSYSPSGDQIVVRLVGGPGQSLDLTLDTGSAAGVAPVTLPAAPPAATPPGPTASPTAVPAAPTQTPASPAQPTATPAGLLATATATPAGGPSATPAPNATAGATAAAPAATGQAVTPLAAPSGPAGATPLPAQTATPKGTVTSSPIAAPPASAVTAGATPAPAQSLPVWLPAVLGAVPVAAVVLYLLAARARRR